MKCIKDHTSGSGLQWHQLKIECELLIHIAAQNILGENHYSHGMRTHKITAQATCIRKIMPPSFLIFVANKKWGSIANIEWYYERTNRHLIKYRGSAGSLFTRKICQALERKLSKLCLWSYLDWYPLFFFCINKIGKRGTMGFIFELFSSNALIDLSIRSYMYKLLLIYTSYLLKFLQSFARQFRCQEKSWDI